MQINSIRINVVRHNLHTTFIGNAGELGSTTSKLKQEDGVRK